VDVRQEADEKLNGHIILELDAETAASCGWRGPVAGVKVWVLEGDDGLSRRAEASGDFDGLCGHGCGSASPARARWRPGLRLTRMR
jgi:hypothetical protein